MFVSLLLVCEPSENIVCKTLKIDAFSHLTILWPYQFEQHVQLFWMMIDQLEMEMRNMEKEVNMTLLCFWFYFKILFCLPLIFDRAAFLTCIIWVWTSALP